MVSLGGSIIYLLSIPVATMGIFWVKKSKNELNGISYFIISVLLTMCYQTFAAVIVDKLNITASIYSVGILNYVLFAVCCLRINSKGIQKYQIKISDIFALIAIAIVVLVLGIRQFGADFTDFAYQSSCDCSRHLLFARQLAVKGEITSIPFMAINTGLVIQALYAFMEPYNDVFIMPITDMIMLYLAGGMMWTLIREKLHGKGMIFAGIVGTIFYLMGYPLNNMVFGTSYLGSGMTISLLVFSLICRYRNREMHKVIFVAALCISFFGLLKSYPMFFPIILVAVLTYYIMQYVKNNIPRLNKFIPFIFTCLVISCGLSICFIFKFIPYDSGVIQSLTMEGYMYRNLYGDFVFLIPFVLYWIYKCYKEKKWSFDFVMIMFMICYNISFLYANFIGRCSSYYYHKLNYLLWAVVFYVLFTVLETVNKETRQFIAVYFFSVIAMWVFVFSGIEGRIEIKSIENGKTVSAELRGWDLFSIYTWNFEHQGMDTIPVPMDEDDEVFYREVAKITVNEGIQIPCINYTVYGDYEYYALGYQWEDWQFKWMDPQSALNRAIEDEYKYISIIYRHCKEMSDEVWTQLAGYTKIYENNAGCIYQVK